MMAHGKRLLWLALVMASPVLACAALSAIVVALDAAVHGWEWVADNKWRFYREVKFFNQIVAYFLRPAA
jgi:hypothetical protein